MPSAFEEAVRRLRYFIELLKLSFSVISQKYKLDTLREMIWKAVGK